MTLWQRLKLVNYFGPLWRRRIIWNNYGTDGFVTGFVATEMYHLKIFKILETSGTWGIGNLLEMKWNSEDT